MAGGEWFSRAANGRQGRKNRVTLFQCQHQQPTTAGAGRIESDNGRMAEGTEREDESDGIGERPVFPSMSACPPAQGGCHRRRGAGPAGSRPQGKVKCLRTHCFMHRSDAADTSIHRFTRRKVEKQVPPLSSTVRSVLSLIGPRSSLVSSIQRP